MSILEINSYTPETIIKSFENIAEKLFSDYQLEVNNNYYRLIDIEFYYFKKGVFEDCYTHKDERQKTNGEWYFHPSGIDITFGNGECYGGILIRGIAEMCNGATREDHFIKKQIHGPQNVQKEIMSKMNKVFSDKPMFFRFVNVSKSYMESGMITPGYIVKSTRIGINKSKAKTTLEKDFFNADFRFLMFFKDYNFNYKEKTKIAEKMLEQIPHLEKTGVNKIMKSKFLK